MNGIVVAVFVTPEAAQPMQQVARALLEPGRGIVGDRYYSGRGTFSAKLKNRPDSEITLIESEQIDYFNDLTGLALAYGAPRRNIVTRGIGLSEWVGARFRVGDVMLEGLRLCEPCAHLAALVAKEVVPALVHRAGLRARIVSAGTISAGDSIGAIAE
jgi:MOSC domain-containing protein YiiM